MATSGPVVLVVVVVVVVVGCPVVGDVGEKLVEVVGDAPEPGEGLVAGGRVADRLDGDVEGAADVGAAEPLGLVVDAPGEIAARAAAGSGSR